MAPEINIQDYIDKYAEIGAKIFDDSSKEDEEHNLDYDEDDPFFKYLPPPAMAKKKMQPKNVFEESELDCKMSESSKGVEITELNVVEIPKPHPKYMLNYQEDTNRSSAKKKGQHTKANLSS